MKSKQLGIWETTTEREETVSDDECFETIGFVVPAHVHQIQRTGEFRESIRALWAGH